MSTLQSRQRFQPHQFLARRDDEARNLLAEAAGADGQTRQRLIEQVVALHLDLANSIARRYAGRGEPLDDLIQVACLGLTKAARGYDPTRESGFAGYAVPTMVGELKRHFRDYGWAVRPPRRVQELHVSMPGAITDLSQELGRHPRPGELAARLGVNEAAVVEALLSDGCYAATSLDQPGPDGIRPRLLDALSVWDRRFAETDAAIIVQTLARELDQRERNAVYLRFYCGWTQDEIAAELGISQMHVSRLLRRALHTMRSAHGDRPLAG